MGVVCDIICPENDGNAKVSILIRRFLAVFSGRVEYFHDLLQTRAILRAHAEIRLSLKTFREDTRPVSGLRPP